jgi:FAD/FMN-containing dehydrogenase
MAGHREIVDRLREIVGEQVIVDPEVVASYTTDWTGRFGGRSAAVVRPGSTEEVAGVVLACRELGVPLVPQGGNTGLVGGSVPLHDEVVLSLRRLQVLEPIDSLSGQITAAAGVVLSTLHQTAGAAGWAYAIDLASRGSATVGGMVATNAGGTHVLRYGDTRAQVLGVEAVLGTGSVVSHLGGLIKDNTGYHLPGLVCGSEGTLAVVTAARLRLVPSLPCRTVAVLAFASVAAALDASVSLRRALPSLEAAELFLAPGLELVCAVTGMRMPFPEPHPVYLLVEAADHTDPTGALAGATASIDHVSDAVVATDSGRRGPHRGRQHPRSTSQARRDRAARDARRLHRPGSRGGPRSRTGRPYLAVRARRRWEHPCERERPAPRRRPGGRCGTSNGRRRRWKHQRRARHRDGQETVAAPVADDRGDLRLPGHQAGARPRHGPQSQRAVSARRGLITSR